MFGKTYEIFYFNKLIMSEDIKQSYYHKNRERLLERQKIYQKQKRLDILMGYWNKLQELKRLGVNDYDDYLQKRKQYNREYYLRSKHKHCIPNDKYDEPIAEVLSMKIRLEWN